MSSLDPAIARKALAALAPTVPRWPARRTLRPARAAMPAPPRRPPAAAAGRSRQGRRPGQRGDITEGDLRLRPRGSGAAAPRHAATAQKRDLLVGYLVDLKLGAKAAEAAKVGDGPEFARKLAYSRDKILLDEYLEQRGQEGRDARGGEKAL